MEKKRPVGHDDKHEENNDVPFLRPDGHATRLSVPQQIN